MTNRSKSLGTSAESAVVKYLLGEGWPDAERLALRGALDVGDVRWTRDVHLEIKAGNMAHTASVAQCRKWLAEADREGLNAGVPCYLVVKRKGYAKPGNWRFFCSLSALTGGTGNDVMIEMPFEEAERLATGRVLAGFDTA